MTNEEFDALLKRRRELEKALEVLRERYREERSFCDGQAQWLAEEELEQVEAQIAAALAEEDAVEATS